jgi:hypothetical protein
MGVIDADRTDDQHVDVAVLATLEPTGSPAISSSTRLTRGNRRSNGCGLELWTPLAPDLTAGSAA